jgi:hypothetical protein
MEAFYKNTNFKSIVEVKKKTNAHKKGTSLISLTWKLKIKTAGKLLKN